MPVFEHRAPMPSSQAALWAWHDSPEAFVRIMPEWERLTPVQLGGLEDGQQTRFKMRLGPLRPMWIAEHFDVKDGQAFSDKMVKGPFGRWDHEHRFDANGAQSEVVDTVQWRLPFHLFSGWTAPITVMPRLRSMFRFRSDRVRGDL
ncbi:MAG: SRPBCC family protein, partial [Candidatus Thermoplasmatota archaeon]|nr:SRPBCC family protein [Candidatus Thermoplasmatota archaeon]